MIDSITLQVATSQKLIIYVLFQRKPTVRWRSWLSHLSNISYELHTEGRRFEPGSNHLFFFSAMIHF